MGDKLYKLIKALGAPFRYEVLGLKNLAGQEPPSIFVSNHLKEVAPIELMISFPARLYPWVISEMMDPTEAPAYLLDDFTRPTLGVDGRAGLALSTLITKLSIPLIRELGGIPAYRRNGPLKKTFELSMHLLMAGKNILVFPEDPDQVADPVTGIKQFLTGFTYLGQLYSQEANSELSFYPLAVEASSKKILIGKKQAYDHSLERAEAMQQLAGKLESQVKALYTSLAAGNRPA
jgi:hypothetical protein